jgi:hypothetical protein
MKKRILKIKFTKGFGNNLFQYSFCRLLAEKQGFLLSHDAIPGMGIPRKIYPFNNGLKLKYIKDIRKKNPDGLLDYHKILNTKLGNSNYQVLGYFEDYTLYKPHLKKIRSWFPSVPVSNVDDAVIHIRLGDRLLCANSYEDFISPEKYKNVLEGLKFNKLYIVTDALKREHITKKDIRKVRRDDEAKRRKLKVPMATFPPLDENKAVEYFNGLVDCFANYEPVIKRGDLMEDFNFIRSFNTIIISNSTFSWWAATLSGAEKIGIYEQWKPHKGNRNKNLGRTDYKGWFSWD